MPDAQPAPSNHRMVNVEAYHHRGPRPTPLIHLAEPAAGPRGCLNENDFGPTPWNMCITKASMMPNISQHHLSSPHSILQHSGILHFYHVLVTFSSLGTTRIQLAFLQIPTLFGCAQSHAMFSFISISAFLQKSKGFIRRRTHIGPQQCGTARATCLPYKFFGGQCFRS